MSSIGGGSFLFRRYWVILTPAITLEAKMAFFGIKGPDAAIVEARSAVNPEVLRDEFIAKKVLLWMQEIIESQLKAVRTSVTNDDLRSFFVKLVKFRADRLEQLIKYLKLRGWLEASPIYPYIPKDSRDKLDAGEAYHLWDHLTFRYDVLRQTQIHMSYINDGDFKLLLGMGEKMLQRQVSILERELKHFGIPYPVRPSMV